MERIFQPNNGSCYACAVAMASNCKLQEVFDFCGHDGKDTDFTDFEMCSFLLQKGLILGYIFRPGTIDKTFEIMDYVIHLTDPALLFIKRKKESLMKSVIYWDGKKVYDPSNFASDKWSLKSYNITNWCVLTGIDIIKKFKKDRFKEV